MNWIKITGDLGVLTYSIQRHFSLLTCCMAYSYFFAIYDHILYILNYFGRNTYRHLVVFNIMCYHCAHTDQRIGTYLTLISDRTR